MGNGRGAGRIANNNDDDTEGDGGKADKTAARERDGGHGGFAAGWSEETRRAEAIPVPVFTMGREGEGEGEENAFIP